MAQRRRKDKILEIITRDGYASIDDLVVTFGVTPQTIRRDLNQLAELKLIDRHHGGAGVLSSTQNTAYTARQEHASDAKRVIAQMLSDYIPDGASLFINIGTTTEAVAKELLTKNGLRIVTNNLHVASILSERGFQSHSDRWRGQTPRRRHYRRGDSRRGEAVPHGFRRNWR